MLLEKDQKRGILHFIFFATLILAGIAVKRILHHPEFMMFFHVPAAVFLVLSGRCISVKLKNRYREELIRRKLLSKDGDYQNVH